MYGCSCATVARAAVELIAVGEGSRNEWTMAPP